MCASGQLVVHVGGKTFEESVYGCSDPSAKPIYIYILFILTFTFNKEYEEHSEIKRNSNFSF